MSVPSARSRTQSWSLSDSESTGQSRMASRFGIGFYLLKNFPKVTMAEGKGALFKEAPNFSRPCKK